MSLLGKIFGDKNKTNGQYKKIELGKNTANVANMIDESMEEPGEPTTNVGPKQPSTTVSCVRRNNTPPPTKHMKIETIDIIGETGKFDTIIIRYPKSYMIDALRRITREYAHKDAESVIGRFILVDVFVNVSLDPDVIDKSRYNGNKWLRVVYELTENNPNPSALTRFPSSMIVVVDETYDAPEMTLDMLMGGKK